VPLLAGESGAALGAGDVALVAGGNLLAAAVSGPRRRARRGTNPVAAVTGTLLVLFLVLPLVQALSGALDLTPFAARRALPVPRWRRCRR
jgi:hypothetical protein